jgi:hypothetical protein
MRVRRTDPWAVIRSIAAAHLRTCAEAPREEKAMQLIAAQLANRARQE